MNQRKIKIITIGIIAIIAVIITYQFISTAIPRKTIPNDIRQYGINEVVGNDNSTVKVTKVEVTKKLGDLINIYEDLKESDFKYRQYDPTDEKVKINPNGDLEDGYSYIKMEITIKSNDRENSSVGLGNAIMSSKDGDKVLSYMYTVDKKNDLKNHSSVYLKKNEQRSLTLAYIVSDKYLEKFKGNIYTVFTFPPGEKDITGVDKNIKLPL